MTVLTSMMSKSAGISHMPASAKAAPAGSLIATSGGPGITTVAKKEPSKRTVANVRKAIEDAAFYNCSKDDDYEGEKVAKKERKGIPSDEDRKLVEALGDDGDDDDDW